MPARKTRRVKRRRSTTTTSRSTDLRRNAITLRALATSSLGVRRRMLANAPEDLILTLVNVARDIINGRLKITPDQLTRLRPYERTLKGFITDKNLSKRRQTLQSGGFLGLLLKPILGILGNALLGGR